MRYDPSPPPVYTRRPDPTGSATLRHHTLGISRALRRHMANRLNVLSFAARRAHPSAMRTIGTPPTDQLDDDPLADLYDYARPIGPGRPRKIKPPSRAKPKQVWRPRITDDWPQRIPITAPELDIFEVHFRDFLDELFDQRP